MTDRVLYKKVGRAPEQPILSIDPGAPEIEAIVAATKQRHITEALAAGSQMPVFRFTEAEAAPF